MVIEGVYLNIIKTICGKSITSITLNSGKLKVFPLKSVTKIEVSPLPFNIILKVLATVIRQETRVCKLEESGETVMMCRGHDTKYRNP